MTSPGQLGALLRPLALSAAMLCATQSAAATFAGAGIDIGLQSVDTLRLIKVKSTRTSLAEVIDALDRNGYQIVSVANTMLNRVLIRARNDRHLREIVVSRASGQILRDGIIEKYRPSDDAPPIPIESLLRNTAQGIGVVDP